MAELAIDIDRKAGTAAPAAADAVPPLQVPPGWGLAALADSGRRMRASALGLAVVAHMAVLLALVREPPDLMAGGGGQKIDAVGVTIVSSEVLESADSDRARAIAAAAASVEANEGAPDSAPSAAAVERQDEKAEKEQPEKEPKKPQEEPVQAAEAIFQVPKEAQHKREQQSPAAPAAGGAAARGDAAIPTNVSAPAAASAGAVREYARYVSQALSRTKPRGAGHHGTVRVKFVIAADGNLASAEVAKSSGSEGLDASALEAVRHARFPVPPPGMSLTELTYEVPYYFR